MSWRADQIYSWGDDKLIDFLQSINAFSKELFLVDDLEGIRSQYTRDFMLSNKPGQHRALRHGLPSNGLLVIKPVVYRTGYDTDQATNDFWKIYEEEDDDINKWDFKNPFEIKEDDSEVLSEENLTLINILAQYLDNPFSAEQLKMLTFLKQLNYKFKLPFIYYYCRMWGGDTEEEIAIVFKNKKMILYAYDPEKSDNIEISESGAFKLKTSVLQAALKHLKLNLPTGFFALHESSFDWKRYHVTP